MSEMLDVEFDDSCYFIGYWMGLSEEDELSYEELESIKQQYAHFLDDDIDSREV